MLLVGLVALTRIVLSILVVVLLLAVLLVLTVLVIDLVVFLVFVGGVWAHCLCLIESSVVVRVILVSLVILVLRMPVSTLISVWLLVHWLAPLMLVVGWVVGVTTRPCRRLELVCLL